jgi:hypothetical protein
LKGKEGVRYSEARGIDGSKRQIKRGAEVNTRDGKRKALRKRHFYRRLEYNFEMNNKASMMMHHSCKIDYFLSIDIHGARLVLKMFCF